MREADQSTASSAEAKNDWSYISTRYISTRSISTRYISLRAIEQFLTFNSVTFHYVL